MSIADGNKDDKLRGYGKFPKPSFKLQPKAASGFMKFFSCFMSFFLACRDASRGERIGRPRTHYSRTFAGDAYLMSWTLPPGIVIVVTSW